MAFADKRFRYRATGKRASHYLVVERSTGDELGYVYRNVDTTLWTATTLQGEVKHEHSYNRYFAAAALVDRDAKREQAIEQSKDQPALETLASYAHPAGRVLGMVVELGPTWITLAVQRTALALPDLAVVFNRQPDGSYKNGQGQTLEWDHGA